MSLREQEEKLKEIRTMPGQMIKKLQHCDVQKNCSIRTIEWENKNCWRVKRSVGFEGGKVIKKETFWKQCKKKSEIEPYFFLSVCLLTSFLSTKLSCWRSVKPVNLDGFLMMMYTSHPWCQHPYSEWFW